MGHHHHGGQGFGSIFARLFSKVAAKTAAKTAAKVAGRKVLRVAAKQGIRIAKEVVQKGVEEFKKVGKDLTVQGLDALTQKDDVVHNVSTVLREGAHRTVDRIGSAADSGIE